MDKSNVIHLNEWKKRPSKKTLPSPNTQSATVTDIVEARNAIINDERRQVKRTILTEFIGASVVVPSQGLLKVSLYDISENGIAFDTEEDRGQFNRGETLAMRVYINHKTYFGFSLKVTNAQPIVSEGVIRHGASFLKDSLNKKALFHFVKFIENISASLQSDSGDIMVSGIK